MDYNCFMSYKNQGFFAVVRFQKHPRGNGLAGRIRQCDYNVTSPGPGGGVGPSLGLGGGPCF